MNINPQFVCESDAIHEDVVFRVRSAMPDNEIFENLTDFYKLFADNTRIKILWALSCEDMCVCDIAVLLGISQSAISHQLKFLRLMNLVKNRKQGKVVYYSLSDSHVKSIFDNGLEHLTDG